MSAPVYLNGKFYSAQMTGVHRVAEELLRATAGAAGEKVGDLRERLGIRLRDAKERLLDLQVALVDKTKAAAEPEAQIETSTLDEIFGEDTADHAVFDKAVGQAYQDPLLRPKQKTTTWERRDKKKDKEPEEADVPELKWLAALVGFVAEYGLWCLVGVLVLMLAITAKRWWPWLLGAAARPEDEPMPVETTAISHNEPLPPDIATVARRLWAEGQPRRALALLYRASVEAMSARVDAHLPPGATEAECLRLSRRMPVAEDRDIFQRMVRIWQYAAYGQRLPAADEFDALLQTLAQRFGWQS